MGSRQIVLVSTAGFSVLNKGIFWREAKTKRLFSQCIVGVNGTLFEDKMRRFQGECAHFSFKKCLIYTHDGARAKLSTNSHFTVC